MGKGTVSTMAAILGVCFSLSAQEKRIPSSIQPASFALSQASPREMVEGRVALKGINNFPHVEQRVVWLWAVDTG